MRRRMNRREFLATVGIAGASAGFVPFTFSAGSDEAARPDMLLITVRTR